jgi:fatty-acyl-CoA synthase
MKKITQGRKGTLMYIGDTLARRAIYTPDALAVVDAGKTTNKSYTYKTLNDRANRFANWLKQAGIKRGDKVGILAKNGVEFLDVFFACGKLGAVFVCFDWELGWRQLTEVVNRTRPKAMIFSDDFADTVAHILFESDSIQALLNIEGYNIQEEHHFEDVLANSSPNPVSTEDFTENDIACVIFTSADSGMPDPISVTYRSIAWNALSTIINRGLQTDDLIMNSFPMYQIGGLLVNILPSFFLGGTVLLASDSNPDHVLQLVDEYKVTILAGLPELYEALPNTDYWHDASLETLRFCVSGGTPLPFELILKYSMNKEIPFLQGFGLNAFGSGIFSMGGEDSARKAGSIGRPSFFVDARVVDENNEPLPEGEVGELVLKGPSVRHDALMTQRDLDVEGWLHTGDLAKYDDEWFFHIVEHRSNLFKRSSSNKTAEK